MAAELLGQAKNPAAHGLLRARYERERNPIVREAISAAVSIRPSGESAPDSRRGRRAVLRRERPRATEFQGGWGRGIMRRGPLWRGVTLKPDEFRLLRDLFATRTGLSFGPEARFAVERRLRERLVVLKLATFAEYHHYLRLHRTRATSGTKATIADDSTDVLLPEDKQLRGFQNEILPALQVQARNRRRLAIWSVGCSTGEEAYTLAIIIDQSGLFLPRRRTASELGFTMPSSSAGDDAACWDVRICSGSDISRRCVAAARRGVYSESSFRATSDDVRRRCFLQRNDGWHVSDSVRQLCHFGQSNLLDEDRSRVLGRADVIFCRNVLIYFDTRARKEAIQVLYERLNPGGILLLGHSESLLNVSTAFELLHLKDDLVYRRPMTAQRPRPSISGRHNVDPNLVRPIRLLVVDDLRITAEISPMSLPTIPRSKSSAKRPTAKRP